MATAEVQSSENSKNTVPLDITEPGQTIEIPNDLNS